MHNLSYHHTTHNCKCAFHSLNVFLPFAYNVNIVIVIMTHSYSLLTLWTLQFVGVSSTPHILGYILFWVFKKKAQYAVNSSAVVLNVKTSLTVR